MSRVIALVGRPNVGKSTLFNRLTRRRDALVADAPGLTRDRRYGVAEFGAARCTLIDTGGLFDETAVGNLMAQQAAIAIDEADLVLFVVDGRAGLTPTDLDIAQQLRRSGRSIVLVDQQNRRRDARGRRRRVPASRLRAATTGIRGAWPRHGRIGGGGARATAAGSRTHRGN